MKFHLILIIQNQVKFAYQLKNFKLYKKNMDELKWKFNDSKSYPEYGAINYLVNKVVL